MKISFNIILLLPILDYSDANVILLQYLIKIVVLNAKT